MALLKPSCQSCCLGIVKGARNGATGPRLPKVSKQLPLIGPCVPKVSYLSSHVSLTHSRTQVACHLVRTEHCIAQTFLPKLLPRHCKRRSQWRDTCAAGKVLPIWCATAQKVFALEVARACFQCTGEVVCYDTCARRGSRG